MITGKIQLHRLSKIFRRGAYKKTAEVEVETPIKNADQYTCKKRQQLHDMNDECDLYHSIHTKSEKTSYKISQKGIDKRLNRRMKHGPDSQHYCK